MKKRQIRDEENELLKEYGIQAEDIVNPGILECEEGEILLEDGQKIDDLLFLVRGQVRTLIPAEGKKGLLVGRFCDRGIFDDTALFRKNSTSHIRAVTESEATVIAMPFEINRRVLLDQPPFLRYLASTFASSIDQAMNSFYFQKYPLEYEVCTYIASNRTDREYALDIPKMCRELAIGERQAERCLNMLCDKGILSRGRIGYRIEDPYRFEEYNRGMFSPAKKGGRHAG
ncbi:MAG: cyclic nucleotide-binding domain-containing protein [Solobacterium sp.]|nr:cyclic nucleotide-binding domain-containing protein [Solobacterium sp.]